MGRFTLLFDLRCVCALLVAPLRLSAPLKAQEQPRSEGMSLAEAVRLTLEHDPSLRLEEVRLRGTHGALIIPKVREKLGL